MSDYLQNCLLVLDLLECANCYASTNLIKAANRIKEWIDVRSGFNKGDKQEIFGQLQAGDTVLLKATEELKPSTMLYIQFMK